MWLRLMFVLVTYCVSVLAVPMITYNNARFDPTNIQSQLMSIFSITTQHACVCHCYTNSSCITSTFIGINQTCILFSAHLQQGQVRVLINSNATVISFPNRTVDTTASALIINSASAITSNIPTTIATSTSTLSASIINSVSTSMISTSTRTTRTSSSTTTTANVCTGGHTYATQLLYLSMSSTLPWTEYIFNYTAPNVTLATLTFSLRNDPDYWYLDDVSVTNSSGQQLLSNGDFEQGTLVNWTHCNPSNAAQSGFVSPLSRHSGRYSYSDGSVGAPDYLSQTFQVQANNTYSVQFWLSSNSTNMTFAWITVFS